MTYICRTCGKQHDDLPRDMAYKFPADYFEVPPDQRERCVWFNDESNPDLCVIEGLRFYIRGVLALPIKGESDEFRWGTWAQIEEENFRHYWELWKEEDVSGESDFRGHLSGGVRDFKDSDGLEVTIELQSTFQRPRFIVVSKQHPLAIAQIEGVTLEDVHDFVLPTPKRN